MIVLEKHEFLAPVGIQKPGRPVYSLSTILTTLFHPGHASRSQQN
jgi:hypothetical protein